MATAQCASSTFAAAQAACGTRVRRAASAWHTGCVVHPVHLDLVMWQCHDVMIILLAAAAAFAG
jgi:hypothetical protein